jgi:membrane fusion protein (multidrug efflux system)
MSETTPPEKSAGQSSPVVAPSAHPLATPPAQPPVGLSPFRQFLSKYGLGILATAIILSIILYFYLPGIFEQETDDAYVEAHIVSIIPKLPAYVSTLLVDDNTRVKSGDLLLVLDQRDYLVESNIDRAGLQVAQSRLNEARSSVAVAAANADEARANVALAQSSATLANLDLKRLLAVSDSRAVSSEKLDAGHAAADGTQAALQAAEMKAAATATQVELARAEEKTDAELVKQARTLLDRAKLDLVYTKIYAPVSGTVARKGVEEGDYVQPGQLLFSIVPDDLYVIANYKETQLKRMRPGQKAEVWVDAFPNARLHGHVDSIQRGTGSRFALLPPENATGNFIKIVQRVPVKIVFDHPVDVLPYLAPGMSVETRVYFSEEAH